MKSLRMISRAVFAIVLVSALLTTANAEDYQVTSNAGIARTEAVDTQLRALNIAVPGPAPAVADIQLYISLDLNSPTTFKKPGDEISAIPHDALPIIEANSQFLMSSGLCYLLDPVDFGQTDHSGKLIAEAKVGRKTQKGEALSLILIRNGVCRTDRFDDEKSTIPSRRNQRHEFRIRDAGTVTRVVNEQGQEFHKVRVIADDPARGYVASYDRINSSMVLSFGPSAKGTINVTFRRCNAHESGLSDNAPAKTIQSVQNYKITFPGNPSPAVQARVRGSLEVSNPQAAQGGENPPSNHALERLLAKNDPVLWDVLVMPTDFGRVYEAGHSGNSVFVISRDSEGALVKSPIRLKTLLETYLNSTSRSSHLAVSDARLVNLRLKVTIGTAVGANVEGILSSVKSQIRSALKDAALDVGESLSLDGLVKGLQKISGVLSVAITAESVSGIMNNRVYSDEKFTVMSGGIVVAPPDTVFDVRYPNADIVIEAAR